VSLVHSTYKCDSEEDKLIPESYLVNTQLPAFMGRYKEIDGGDLPPVWSISNQSVLQAPKVSNDLDWLLRFSESNTLIQRCMRSPFLFNGKKANF